jgi:cation diffusion facilitator CzcD-associated flavoprotein CzcO
LKDHRIAVIGAGPCGLAACRVLSDYGLNYSCFEAGSEVGGTWNIEGGGGGYRSLQTNTSRPGMSYVGFPFQEGNDSYATAQQMVQYFRSYAEHFRLGDSIRFGSRVRRASPLSSGGWQIELENGEIGAYTSVVVASGQYAAPQLPHDSFEGEFSGEVMHVSHYLDPMAPLDLRGKRVMVVGLGSSAAEVAAELCNREATSECAGQVILSARSGRWVLPKMIDGVPLDARSLQSSARLPALLRALPSSLALWVMRRTMASFMRNQTTKLGGAEALGLPQPAIQPWEDRPTVSIDFIPALQARRIDVRPGIRRFEGSTVHFRDGTCTEVDAIIYATGYELSFPFLDWDTLACEAPELKLYQRISHPDHDRLFFVGCCRAMCSLWPLAEQQTHWIANLLAGSFQLPGKRKRAIRAVPLSDSLPVMCNHYVEGLRREAKADFVGQK